MIAVVEKTTIEITSYKPEYDSDIMILCQLFVNESLKEYGIDVTPDRLGQMIELCKNISFFLVVNDRPQGLIAGMPIQSMTDQSNTLQEVIWYVNPLYRRHGMKLLKVFEQRAIDLGLDSVLMALMCNSKQDKLDKLYRKLGYIPFEMQYLKRLDTGDSNAR